MCQNEIVELMNCGYIDHIYKQLDNEFSHEWDTPISERHSMWEERDARSRELTEEYANKALTLPLFPGMTVEQQDLVITSLRKRGYKGHSVVVF